MVVDVEIVNQFNKPTINMGKCANCGTALSCGCQVRKLHDGTIGCTNCAGKAKKIIDRTDKPIVNTSTKPG